MAFQLPNIGDAQGQINAGQKLYTQITQAAGDPAAAAGLLEAGISLAGNAIGGEGGQLVGDIFGGALSGFAMAGPVGAIVGGIIGVGEAFASLFSSGYQGVDQVFGVSKGTQTITGRVNALTAQHMTPMGVPAGWPMADWCATARPPSTTKNRGKLWAMMQTTAEYVALEATPSSMYPSFAALLGTVGASGYNSAGSPSATYGGPLTQLSHDGGGNPNALYPVYAWAPRAQSADAKAQTFLKQFGGAPLCTPVFFDWYNPSAIIDCTQVLNFGSGGAGGSTSDIEARWKDNTFSKKGMSQAQIVAAAQARAPDPLYWSTALYGVQVTGGSFGSTNATILYNPDLMNGMVTVLAMLSSGASTQSIVSELLLQAYILGGTQPGQPAEGSIDPYGNPLKVWRMAHAGFFQLLDDYIALAKAENEKSKSGSSSSSASAASSLSSSAGLSTAGKVGAMAAGIAGASIAGVLGYSALTRTPPGDVLKSVGTRLRRI